VGGHLISHKRTQRTQKKKLKNSFSVTIDSKRLHFLQLAFMTRLFLVAFAALGIGTSIAQTPVPINGMLGKPFGEKIEISGTIPSRAYMVSNPIEISVIDGKLLKESIIIEVRPDSGIGKIEKGFHYALIGYESGGFEGPPMWVNPEVQQPFQFRHFFIATELVEKKPISTSSGGDKSGP
jgi:hypothetical protein